MWRLLKKLFWIVLVSTLLSGVVWTISLGFADGEPYTLVVEEAVTNVEVMRIKDVVMHRYSPRYKELTVRLANTPLHEEQSIILGNKIYRFHKEEQERQYE